MRLPAGVHIRQPRRRWKYYAPVVDNALTGSDNSDIDLWVFEVGGEIEDTFIEISTDGIVWSPVGKVFGSVAGVDIDAFGFGSGDTFPFVRLTDDTDEDSQCCNNSLGADIDAVGAISTVVRNVPSLSPIAIALLGTLMGLAGYRRLRT